MNVKNGRGISFWLNKWCSRVPLEKLFPQMFAVAHDPSGTVFAHWGAGGWNIKVPQFYQDALNGSRECWPKGPSL